MTTRCKFLCTGVEKTIHWQNKNRHLYTARFSAVTDGSEENKKFFEYTPSGDLKIGTYKEDVFLVGKEYYLDISSVEAQ